MDEVVKFSKNQDQEQAKMLGEAQAVPETGASDSLQKVLSDFLHKSDVSHREEALLSLQYSCLL
jgi:hypothetical protein